MHLEATVIATNATLSLKAAPPTSGTGFRMAIEVTAVINQRP